MQIIGQVAPAANVPTDVDSYECEPDEVKIVRRLATGDLDLLSNA